MPESVLNEEYIYVRSRDKTRYIRECILKLHKGVKKIHIKAWGNMIPNAIDIVMTIKRSFMPDLVIENIEIGFESIANRRKGKLINTSFIDITIRRGI